MGCCQSRAVEYNDNRSSESPTLPDVCYPDKIGIGGVKVLTSSASSPAVSPSPLASRGRTYTRLVIGTGWIFAALFEGHGGSEKGGHCGSRDAAARFCAAHCYAEFQRAMEGAACASKGTSADSMCTTLVTTLRALDRRFLNDDGISPQERLSSGCTAVLLHISLGEKPLATVASVGPCAAVVGQRRGGLASATSAPLVLCGGASSSHGALKDFLTTLASEQPGILAATTLAGTVSKKGRKSIKASPVASSKDMLQRGATIATFQGAEPEYSRESTAPQALGFGYGKCMKVSPTGRGTVDEQPREPRVGLEIQTGFYELGPSDECIVLLSGGAAASISPVDVALLMHRMGRLAAIPYETKLRPLPHDVSRGPVAQLDNLGVAGPPPAPSLAAAAHTIAPFNAARLLVQQAVANVAARGHKTSGVPVGIMAFALEWPRGSDDSGAAAAAIGASVSAVCAAAAAAVSSRQRAQYRWQLLRLYYKFPHKRRVVIINKWHEVFDRVVGEGKRTANLKETAAWLRLGAAVKVSAAGSVQCLSSREEATEQLAHTPTRRTSSAQRQNRSTVGGIPSPSPMHGMDGQRLQSRPPLSAAGANNTYSSPGQYRQPAGSNPPPQSPIRVASSNSMLGHRSPSLGATNLQQQPPSLSLGAVGTSRSLSHREFASATATATAAATAAAIVAAGGPGTDPRTFSAAPRESAPAGPAASLPCQGPVGLLEVEGIDIQRLSGPKLRSNQATADSSKAVPFSSLVGTSQKTPTADDGTVSAAVATKPPATAVSGLALPEWSIAWGNTEADSGFHSSDALKLGPNDFPSSLASSNLSITPVTAPILAKPPVMEAAAASNSPNIGHPRAQRASRTDAHGAATTVLAITSKSTPASAITSAAAVKRIPSRSAGNAPVTSPSGSSSITDCSSFTHRSPPSRIPTLLLKPGPIGAAFTAHETPRLSMPGGTPISQPTPASSAVQPAPVNATPRIRGSATWGGAGPTSIPTFTPSTAPNSARSGSSRLPRAPNLSTPSAAPSMSPAGSISNHSPFAASDAGSVPRTAITTRPPRLEVAACGLTGQPPTGEPAADNGDDLDIFSPDAEQLAAWAMEAVDAIGASAKKLSQQQQSQDSAPLSSRSVKSAVSRTFSGARSEVTSICPTTTST